MLSLLTEALPKGQSLSREQIADAVRALTDPELAAETKAAFLMALNAKGETVEEIAGFAFELRERAIRPVLDEATRQGEILDVCGTGGDRLGTFNISTTVAIVAAAAGVKVAKHGNRAMTSQTGSADVLDELGIPTQLPPDEAARALAKHNFAFFFAPMYHPAFKHIAPCRKLCAERGQRTIFNFLGPLLNPVRPTAQLMGVARPELCGSIARVLQQLGGRRGMVVSGQTSVGALDELCTFATNAIAEFYQDRGFHESILDPAPFGFAPAGIGDLKGGDRQANAAILRAILQGQDRGARRDAVLFNSAAALFVASRVANLHEGVTLAAEVIDRGQALAKLEELAGGAR